jgi:hypothetical protein
MTAAPIPEPFHLLGLRQARSRYQARFSLLQAGPDHQRQISPPFAAGSRSRENVKNLDNLRVDPPLKSANQSTAALEGRR